VMTSQGIGAALSPAIGGWIAQTHGYPAAFLWLGALAVGSLILWIRFAGVLSRASAPQG
jgi:MFS family permease